MYLVIMTQTSAPNLRYVGMCIGENIWVSCPGVPLPERQPKKPSSFLRLIKRLKKRPESFHIVAEPGRELDLFELDVAKKFHDANIPISFVDRSWLYEFREALPDGDRYYIDADLVERYGREKRPKPTPLPSQELQDLASFARTVHVIDQAEELFDAIRRREEPPDQATQVPQDPNPELVNTRTLLREQLQKMSETFDLIQKYCSKTGHREALAILLLVTIPDSFYAEIGID
jgi:hypothetical protein